jgi:hypothetical protein
MLLIMFILDFLDCLMVVRKTLMVGLIQILMMSKICVDPSIIGANNFIFKGKSVIVLTIFQRVNQAVA